MLSADSVIRSDFFYEMVALLPVMEQLPELFECIYEKASIGYILLKLLVSYGKGSYLGFLLYDFELGLFGWSTWANYV